MAKKSFGRIFTDDNFSGGTPVLNRPYGYDATPKSIYTSELQDLLSIGFNTKALAQMTSHMKIERRISLADFAFDPDISIKDFMRYANQLLEECQDDRDKNYLNVQEIIDLIDLGGFRDSDILSAFPHLVKSDLTACRAFAAVNMPGSSEYYRNNRYSSVKVLLDENMPHDLILPLSHHTSNLSHIYYEGMGGYMDEFIYWRPFYQLKDRSTETEKQRSKRLGIKHIIISNDSDLCDLAEDQWRQRIATSSNPDQIDFNDTNTVFRIEKQHFEKLKDPDFCEQVARGIMRAAFNPKSPWYKIRGNGSVYPGILFTSLCHQMEEKLRVSRFMNGTATEEEAQVERQKRLQRNIDRRALKLNGQNTDTSAGYIDSPKPDEMNQLLLPS